MFSNEGPISGAIFSAPGGPVWCVFGGLNLRDKGKKIFAKRDYVIATVVVVVAGCVCHSVRVCERVCRAYYGRVCESSSSSSDFPFHFGKIVEKSVQSVATTHGLNSRSR